jgi:hypothetical protein
VLRDPGPEIRRIQSFVIDDQIDCIYCARDDSLIPEHAMAAVAWTVWQRFGSGWTRSISR